MRTLFLSFALVACTPGTPRPVSLPAPAVPLSTDTFFTTSGSASWSGGDRAVSAETLEARCLDPAVCFALVERHTSERGTAAQLQIVPVGAGSTTVDVEVVNPLSKQTEHRSLAITVTPPPERALLSLGAVAPMGDEILHQVAGSTVGLCTTDSGFDSEVSATERPGTRLYACSTSVEIAGQHLYRMCETHLCNAPGESYLLCAQVKDGAIAATAVIEHAKTGFEVKHTEGTFDPGVCGVR